ncbi:DUF397 domain-containing protein [Streptomyces sp. NPDC051555]|uniref:DUF397 domain-containing protein n=1 Tax=Streptomyces sp. NPDC051555 TaxID=3365657 RepID=UPI00379B8081
MSTTFIARPDGDWFKSSFSNGGDPNCVEARAQCGTVHLRDSKRKDELQYDVVAVSPAAFSAFVSYLCS